MGMALVTFKTKAEEMCIANYNLGRLLIFLGKIIWLRMHFRCDEIEGC
jgi:hypothetical protein